jgi:hypothetical protein
MTTFLKWTAIVVFTLVALFATLVGWFRWAYPSASANYRLTVAVEADDRVVSGHSVLNIAGGMAPQWFGARLGGWSRVRGEAVGVDLGPRGRLWMVMTRPPAYPDSFLGNLAGTLYARAGVIPKEGGGGAAEYRRRSKAIAAYRTPIPLLPSDYPLFVRFRDEADPATLELVDPANLAASFGEGVRLREVTIAITDEAPTRNVEKALPWLADVGRSRAGIIPILRDKNYRPTTIERVAPSDFVSSSYLYRKG